MLGVDLKLSSLALGSLGGAGNALTPPSGFVFLLDADGAYLLDADGSYLLDAA